jgi:hypothetical protein
LTWNGCPPGLAADRANQIELGHQTARTVATAGDGLSPQLLPHLLDSVDVEVVAVDSGDLGLQLLIALPAR